MMQTRVVAGIIVLVACFAFACSSSDPTPADAGSDANGDGDASSADPGLPPIACGDRGLICSGATPYCLKSNTCGFGPMECTYPTLDGGIKCPVDYGECSDVNQKPGCAALYDNSCVAAGACQQVGPRTFSNCDC